MSTQSNSHKKDIESGSSSSSENDDDGNNKNPESHGSESQSRLYQIMHDKKNGKSSKNRKIELKFIDKNQNNPEPVFSKSRACLYWLITVLGPLLFVFFIFYSGIFVGLGVDKTKLKETSCKLLSKSFDDCGSPKKIFYWSIRTFSIDKFNQNMSQLHTSFNQNEVRNFYDKYELNQEVLCYYHLSHKNVAVFDERSDSDLTIMAYILIPLVLFLWATTWCGTLRYWTDKVERHNLKYPENPWYDYGGPANRFISDRFGC